MAEALLIASSRSSAKASNKAAAHKSKGRTRAKAEASGVDTNAVALLETIESVGVKVLRDRSKVTKQQFIEVINAAIAVLLGVGLGRAKSAGFGPFARSIVVRLIGGMIGKKSVPVTALTADNVIRVLEAKTFSKQGLDALKGHISGLDPEAEESTLKAREQNRAKAENWISTEGYKVYLIALRVVVAAGRQVHFKNEVGATISLPLDEAIGIAYGRSLTANRLLKYEQRTVAAK